MFDESRPVADQLPSFPVGKPLPADRNLQRTLDELDTLIRRDYPELYARFRPGLAQAEIDRLQRKLAPYSLPKELSRSTAGTTAGTTARTRVLEFHTLFPDDRFNSLARAISERTST